MPLPKGRTNNLNGRPKGTVNKNRAQLRELIAAFLDKNFRKIERMINELEPREQVKVYIDLLQYGIPKLQSVSTFEHMSEEQLDEILKRLLDGNTNYQEREREVSHRSANGQEKYN